MDNKFTQIGIQYSSFGDNAQIEVQQTIIVPRKSTSIPSDVRQGSPNFVGRVDDLRGLHEALQKDKIVSVCAVRGMGGVGKTELAIQYALSQEFQQRYVACYWFSLNEGNLASLVLQKAAPYLAMPEEIQKSDNVYEQVKWCWQNWHPPEGEILVILDDVKSLDDIPKQAMPIAPRFKVMLTTRQRNLSPSFRELQLGVLPEHEALELLKRIVDRDGSSRIESELGTAREICRYLGYLPLALELAATYLVEDEMLTLEEYWQQLNLQDRSISDEMVKYITAERGVVSAFALSWLRLRDLSPQVAMLLGRFAPADIPWQDLVEPTVKSLGWDEEAVRKGRVQLANLHLISIREQKNIGIHSLLREYFRWQADNEGDDFIRFLQRAIVESGISISKTIPPTPVKDDIQRVGLAISHLDILSREMLGDIPNPEEDLIWAFTGTAWFYEGQGLYALAEDSYQRCLKATQELFGDRHPNVATSLNNLAELNRLQGRYEEAEPLHQQALALRQELLGDSHPDVATSLNNLALLYYLQGRYEEAEPPYQQALVLMQELLGDRHPNLASIINNLAALYYSQGRYEEAEPLCQQALVLRQELLGDRHPNVAKSLNNLADLYRLEGRYEAAEPLFQQALVLRQELLGDRHPDVAQSLNNLALLYYLQGRYEAAEPLYQQGLALWQELLGDRHPDVALSLNNLAGLYRSQGRYEEAEPLYQQALTLRQELLGDRHPDVASSINNLADLYRLQGRYEAAEPLYQQALTLWQELLGDRHPDVASSINNLALLYKSQGRYEEAEPLYQQALVLRQELLGDHHPNVAESLSNLAGLYLSQGKYEEAEPLYKQTISLMQELLGDRHPDVATIINNLAFLYKSQGRYEEAEPLYQQALALRQELLGDRHPDVAQSLNNLAELYYWQGRYAEVESLFIQALQIDEAVLGRDHPNTKTTRKNLEIMRLVSLFIRALNFGFLKPLRRVTQFFHLCRARIIHDTNIMRLWYWWQWIVTILLIPFYLLFILIRWLIRLFFKR
jgi:tetratricopeptide (TPR) repeat protein